MSQYVQLLGSDTPNGYGGCCFYGPLDHPALHEAATGTLPATHRDDVNGDGAASMCSSGMTLHAMMPEGSSAPLGESHKSSGANSSTTLATFPSREGAVQNSINRDAAGEQEMAKPWNWSSYLTSRRPSWPRTGPFHPDSVLHPTPSNSSSSSSTAAAAMAPGAAPRVTADTGSSGSEGYLFFNCPEGTQRFSSEANIKLKKVRGFFFTRWSAMPSGGTVTAYPVNSGNASTDVEGVGAASAVMGLPGMLFTINDAGARHATFFGPSAVLDQDTHHHGDRDGGMPTSSAGAALQPPAPTSPPASASASAVAAGLRGFLSALRFHYFQYRPMVFRQLHGVVPCRPHGGDVAETASARGAPARAAAALMAVGNNQLHFVETAAAHDEHDADRGSCCGGGGGAGTLAGSAEPFLHLVLPLSPQSLLIAFRVSSGPREEHRPSVPRGAAGPPTCAASEQEPQPQQQQQQQQQATVLVASKADAFSTTPHVAASSSDGSAPAAAPLAFRAPSSPNVVLGYAVVVAPGASFDAARARALGIKPGPKYGQLKQGLPVEVDHEDGSAGSGNATEAMATGERDEKPRRQTPPPPQQQQRRLVHPFEVMRPTPATRHAYVSLVLDGDAPVDVQTAMPRLLGRSARVTAAAAVAAAHTSKGSPSALGAADADAERGVETQEAPHRGEEEDGVLAHLLRHRFPHLAYFYDDEEEHTRSGAGRGGGEAKPEATRELRRRRRQLSVRHVVHVQPASYFSKFQQHHRSPAIDSASVYAAYNAFVFAHVARRGAGDAASASSTNSSSTAMGLSLTPSLSFTLSDLADVDGTGAAPAVADSPVSGTPSNTTWHLFTSFVQRHYTAFPTALVHRFHLHHLAPSLFPLQTQNSTSAASHTGSVDDEVEYWPYSLKLRCVPEAALQLPRQPSTKAAATAASSVVSAPSADKSQPTTSTAPASSDAAARGQLPISSYTAPRVTTAEVSARARYAGTAQDTAASTTGGVSRVCGTATTTMPPSANSAPRKRDRQGENAAVALPRTCTSPSTSSSVSTAAASMPSRKAKAAVPPRHLCVADGLASLLPYPTRASALALLSHCFLHSLTSTTPPADVISSAPPTRDSADVVASEALRRGAGGGGLLGFLGTGSAVPSKYRNVSGTFLELHLPACCFPPAVLTTDTDRHGARVDERVYGVCDEEQGTRAPAHGVKLKGPAMWRRGVVILDFGEGSLGQLASLCGRVRCGARGDGTVVGADAAACFRDGAAPTTTSAAREDLTRAVLFTECVAVADADDASLRAFVLDIVLVFISHAHADHHVGLLSLLTLRHHYLHSAHGGGSPSQGQYRDETQSRQRLLVVCPTEVYAFVMDTWGCTAPYAAWLHEDCTFELMPPPTGVLTPSAAHEADTQEAEAVLEGEDVPACRHLAHASAYASDGHVHGEHGSQQQPQQHVVPMPLLKAHIAAWNAAIASASLRTEGKPVPHSDKDDPELQRHQHQHQQPLSNIPQQHPVWWDAEVITVDHPANAHALLLRFPYCTAARASQYPDAAVDDKTDEEASGCDWVGTSPALQEVPDTSRVLLFSGDTRPSTFLVERSRIFSRSDATHDVAGALSKATATATHTPPPAVVAPVFILLHEATFGPGFESEALRKKHSTLPEALGIGAAVGAEFVVLNHFSQRYPKLPGLSEEQLGGRSADLVCQRKGRPTTEDEVEEPGVTEHSPSAGVVKGAGSEAEGSPGARSSSRSSVSYANMSFAFDLMSVSFTDMHRGLVPRLTPTLVRLLEEYDSWGASTTQRMRSGGMDGGKRGGGGGGRKQSLKPPVPTSTAKPEAAESAMKWKGAKTH